MSKPLWFHKTKSNRIILLGPKQEDAAGGCREREGRPCAREAAAEVSRTQNRPSRSRLLAGVQALGHRAQNRPSRSREAAA